MEGLEEVVGRGDAADPAEGLQRDDARQVALGGGQDGEALAQPRPEGAHPPVEPDQAEGQRGGHDREHGDGDRRVAGQPRELEGRQVGEVGQVGDDAQRPGPGQQRDAHHQVEQRLGHQRRGQRRVGRPLHPPVEQEELDHVAASRGRHAVDAHAGAVRAEGPAPAHVGVRVRGGHDVPPRARAQQQVEQVESERERQGRPADRPDRRDEAVERVEEALDRVHAERVAPPAVMLRSRRVGLSERALIERIAALTTVRAGVAVGIGDDAAVLDDDPATVASQDMLVEGVHFRRRVGDAAELRDAGPSRPGRQPVRPGGHGGRPGRRPGRGRRAARPGSTRRRSTRCTAAWRTSPPAPAPPWPAAT